MSRSLADLEDFVRQRVEVDRVSQRQLSEELKTSFPGSKGFIQLVWYTHKTKAVEGIMLAMYYNNCIAV